MRTYLIVIGTIAGVTGLVLTLGGLNIIGASGDSTWAIIGPIVAVVGMLVLVVRVPPARRWLTHRAATAAAVRQRWHAWT